MYIIPIQGKWAPPSSGHVLLTDYSRILNQNKFYNLNRVLPEENLLFAPNIFFTKLYTKLTCK